jgi:hypothetical protein
MTTPQRFIEQLGFVPVNLGLRGRRGYRHPDLRGRGAIYVDDARISASGAWIRLLEDVVDRSDSDLGYPVWQGRELGLILEFLATRFSPPPGSESEPPAADQLEDRGESPAPEEDTAAT